MMELQGAEDAIVLALGLLEAAPDAILVIRPGGTIALANRMAERVFGYDRAELIGMPVESLVPQEHRHDHGSKRARYEQSGRTRTMGDLATLAAVRKSGDTVPVEISLSPVETSIGKLTIAIVRSANAKVLFCTHHEPTRSDDALELAFQGTLQSNATLSQGMDIRLAREGDCYEF